MNKLTSDKVRNIFLDCFFEDSVGAINAVNAVLVEGVLHNYGFDPQKLKDHENEIIEMLNELPRNFHSTNGGGGWSFLNACEDKNGNLWGEHVNVEQLLVLGLAIGKASFLFPKDMWQLLPGGMPYFSINT